MTFNLNTRAENILNNETGTPSNASIPINMPTEDAKASLNGDSIKNTLSRIFFANFSKHC